MKMELFFKKGRMSPCVGHVKRENAQSLEIPQIFSLIYGYTVEKSGFKLLVSKLNPRYNLPSRKHFTEVEIPKLYVEVRDTVVKPKLAEVEFFSATTDLWTS